MSERRRDLVVWVRSDLPAKYDERKAIVTAALENGYFNIVTEEKDESLRKLGIFNTIIRKGNDFIEDDEVIGKLLEIRSPRDLKEASKLKDRVKYLVISAKDWKVIPLENLIAEFQTSGTGILACTSTPDEAKLFTETLEVGVTGLVIEPSSALELRDFRTITAKEALMVELTVAPVSRIAPLPSGDRVCVDTCSLLRVGEGMLVGSQSSCLFLVQSESMESEYVAARPFRVNAGAVHAYVLAADGKTKYLSEVSSGDELLAVDMKGNCRGVVVGRSKIERRPLLLIEVDLEGSKYTTILQNAETIRLCTPEASVSVSGLKIGDRVLVRVEKGGRHFGHPISETIMER